MKGCDMSSDSFTPALSLFSGMKNYCIIQLAAAKTCGTPGIFLIGTHARQGARCANLSHLPGIVN
eukprot:CAMPEP_0204645088 /NCGR_PEP_ID=MMETSP0718-20130828/1931_1 /ASSEMBLY_ACC=CAM_ASM_000674 /TAXON_ID=230516 /ORGANISM="Chaetoceros curvisetus" /LENGTH=64 /DNA_ID=CAMNT_0051666833 /DNA_START=442 /DNA_END=636 /DNA_ORIENTATION=+